MDEVLKHSHMVNRATAPAEEIAANTAHQDQGRAEIADMIRAGAPAVVTLMDDTGTAHSWVMSQDAPLQEVCRLLMAAEQGVNRAIGDLSGWIIDQMDGSAG